MTLPLAGQTILVTRAADQAATLAERLRACGAAVVEAAAIEVAPPEDPAPFESALERLERFDWLLVTSPNGARAVVTRVGAWPAGLRVGAVGPATAAVLEAAGAPVALVPTQTDGEGLARALGAEGLAGARVLVARGDLAGPEPLAALEACGAEVTAVVAYRTLPAPLDGEALAARVLEGEIGWVAVMSGSAYRHLATALGPAAMERLRVASVGPRTSEAIRALGGTVAVEARERSVQGLVEALSGAV